MVQLSRTPRTQRHRRERTRERAESHSSTDQQGRPGGSNSQCPLDSELLRLAGDGESEQGQQVVMYDSSSDESSDDGEEDHGVMLMSTKHRKPMRKTYNGRERQIRQRDEMRELALRGTGDRETSLVPTMKRRKRTRIMPTCGMLQLTHSPAVHKNSSSEVRQAFE